MRWRNIFGCGEENVPPSSPPSRVRRRHYVFSGHVQGVGFRYTAWVLARDLGLTGWVKNLPDGSVAAEAEGEEEKLDHFVQAIKSRRGIYITDIQVREQPVRADEAEFRIAN